MLKEGRDKYKQISRNKEGVVDQDPGIQLIYEEDGRGDEFVVAATSVLVDRPEWEYPPSIGYDPYTACKMMQRYTSSVFWYSYLNHHRDGIIKECGYSEMWRVLVGTLQYTAPTNYYTLLQHVIVAVAAVLHCNEAWPIRDDEYPALYGDKGVKQIRGLWHWVRGFEEWLARVLGFSAVQGWEARDNDGRVYDRLHQFPQDTTKSTSGLPYLFMDMNMAVAYLKRCGIGRGYLPSNHWTSPSSQAEMLVHNAQLHAMETYEQTDEARRILASWHDGQNWDRRVELGRFGSTKLPNESMLYTLMGSDLRHMFQRHVLQYTGRGQRLGLRRFPETCRPRSREEHLVLQQHKLVGADFGVSVNYIRKFGVFKDIPESVVRAAIKMAPGTPPEDYELACRHYYLRNELNPTPDPTATQMRNSFFYLPEHPKPLLEYPYPVPPTFDIFKPDDDPNAGPQQAGSRAQQTGVQQGVQTGGYQGVQTGVEQGVQTGGQQGVQTGGQQGGQYGGEQGVQTGGQQGVQTGGQQGGQYGGEQGVQTGGQQGGQYGGEQGGQLGMQQGVQYGGQQGRQQGVQYGVQQGGQEGRQQGVQTGVQQGVQSGGQYTGVQYGGQSTGVQQGGYSVRVSQGGQQAGTSHGGQHIGVQYGESTARNTYGGQLVGAQQGGQNAVAQHGAPLGRQHPGQYGPDIEMVDDDDVQYGTGLRENIEQSIETNRQAWDLKVAQPVAGPGVRSQASVPVGAPAIQPRHTASPIRPRPQPQYYIPPRPAQAPPAPQQQSYQPPQGPPGFSKPPATSGPQMPSQWPTSYKPPGATPSESLDIVKFVEAITARYKSQGNLSNDEISTLVKMQVAKYNEQGGQVAGTSGYRYGDSQGSGQVDTGGQVYGGTGGYTMAAPRGEPARGGYAHLGGTRGNEGPSDLGQGYSGGQGLDQSRHNQGTQSDELGRYFRTQGRRM